MNPAQPAEQVVRIVGAENLARNYAPVWLIVSVLAIIALIWLYFRYNDLRKAMYAQIADLKSRGVIPPDEPFIGSGGDQVYEDVNLATEGACGGRVDWGAMYASQGGKCGKPMTANEAYAFRAGLLKDQAWTPITGSSSSKNQKIYMIRKYPEWVQKHHPEWFKEFPMEAPAGYTETFTDNQLTAIAAGVRNS